MIGDKSLKIAAVFATMNRSATALACVRALAAQTRPPDLVVVADNVSTDGTADHLENLRSLPFRLVVIRMPENLGNAGGVRDAMEHAFADGADAVWILDDDSWPRPDALAAMLAPEWRTDVVRHALQIDPATGRFTWPLWIGADGAWKLVGTKEELPAGALCRSRISWTGALLPREVRGIVGPVTGELFIRGEDEEYPWRIERAGIAQEAVCGAIMDHPGPANIVHWRGFGKNFFFERGLADWKLYYKVRNMVWLKRRQSGRLKALLTGAGYAMATCRFDGFRRWPVLMRAFSDGWAGRLGKKDGWPPA